MSSQVDLPLFKVQRLGLMTSRRSRLRIQNRRRNSKHSHRCPNHPQSGQKNHLKNQKEAKIRLRVILTNRLTCRPQIKSHDQNQILTWAQLQDVSQTGCVVMRPYQAQNKAHRKGINPPTSTTPPSTPLQLLKVWKSQERSSSSQKMMLLQTQNEQTMMPQHLKTRIMESRRRESIHLERRNEQDQIYVTLNQFKSKIDTI